VVGLRLFLPVHTAGALLSFADGNALQDDGEVSVLALGTSLRGTFQIVMHMGTRLRWPRAEAPTRDISLGIDPQLTRLPTADLRNDRISDSGRGHAA
jgi:acetamidase/formamidase